MAIQAEIAATDDNADRFRAAGVDVLAGAARLTSPTTVQVGEAHATRFVLLATGSRPALPPIDGLAAAAPLTSEQIFTLPRAPRSVVMIGGGPIGGRRGRPRRADRPRERGRREDGACG